MKVLGLVYWAKREYSNCFGLPNLVHEIPERNHPKPCPRWFIGTVGRPEQSWALSQFHGLGPNNWAYYLQNVVNFDGYALITAVLKKKVTP